MGNPIYCKDCNSRGSWQRFPERDSSTHKSKTALNICFKCRVCGALTWYPIETVKWVDTGKEVKAK